MHTLTAPFSCDLLTHRQAAHQDGSHSLGPDEVAYLEHSLEHLRRAIAAHHRALPRLHADSDRDRAAYQELEAAMKANPISSADLRSNNRVANIGELVDCCLDLSNEDWATVGPAYQEPAEIDH